MAQRSRELVSDFEGISRALKSVGYKVVRVPFLFGGPEANPEEGDGGMRAAFPMLTYNNVLLEVRDGEKRVYLPQYGLSQLDAVAHRSWSNGGFVPYPVAGLTISAMYGGALRCSAKVLSRQR